MTSWLVTGGAGYIGAHVVRALLDEGERVVVIDDLSTGATGRTGTAALVNGSILDEDLVRTTLKEHAVQGIVHIAAKKQVGESVADPLFYYRENVGGLVSLLRASVDAGVDAFVFSSSAATYGLPQTAEVTEDSPTIPISPYGETKVIGEWIARDVANITSMRAVSLRYFNVAGCMGPELGDPGVFNLIPLVFQSLANGEPPQVFGDDYPTHDGTCIRDYIHVGDIADAHVAALRHLAAGGASATYNIGRGEGVSVYEVLRTVEDVTGIPVRPKVVARRPGDPAHVVAVVDKIKAELGWQARYDLRDMVESAWTAWVARHGRPATAS
ncbi:MAG: UDP-glucose 4-epimerase GalE [Actinomycetes bacterium]